jgi:hypothetical protein
MVLDADQIKTGPIGRQHLLDDLRIGLGVWRDRDAEDGAYGNLLSASICAAARSTI